MIFVRYIITFTEIATPNQIGLRDACVCVVMWCGTDNPIGPAAGWPVSLGSRNIYIYVYIPCDLYSNIPSSVYLGLDIS